MTEREKMTSKLYGCGEPELSAQWYHAKDLTYDYNTWDSRDTEKKEQILKKLLGGFGQNLWITAIIFSLEIIVNMNCTFLDNGRIIAGAHVWIGGAVILPGVAIGAHVVIGADSVVTKNIPSNTIAYSNPCRVVRDYASPLVQNSAKQEGQGVQIL